MIRTLIVEDEPLPGRHLEEMLQRNFTDLQILPICDSIDTAFRAILKFNPDLVFLDIMINEESSFHLLQRLPSVEFKIIFTTAHREYAIQAIKFSALDYLLKPIDEDELKSAVRRFIANRSPTTIEQRELLLDHRPGDQQSRIALVDTSGFTYIHVGEIIFCKGESNQTMIQMTNKKQSIQSKILGAFEDLLEPFHFCRIHKSYVVNLKHVTQYLKSGSVKLSEGYLLPVSHNYKDELLSRLPHHR